MSLIVNLNAEARDGNERRRRGANAIGRTPYHVLKVKSHLQTYQLVLSHLGTRQGIAVEVLTALPRFYSPAKSFHCPAGSWTITFRRVAMHKYRIHLRGTAECLLFIKHRMILRVYDLDDHEEDDVCSQVRHHGGP